MCVLCLFSEGLLNVAGGFIKLIYSVALKMLTEVFYVNYGRLWQSSFDATSFSKHSLTLWGFVPSDRKWSGDHRTVSRPV